MTHPDTLTIPRAVVEQAIDALALYASTYNLYWIRGMPILEPSAEAVLEQLRAALQPQADTSVLQAAPWPPAGETLTEPEAMRYDSDGYGWKYIDNGSGSDWMTRHPEGEFLFTKPQALQPQAAAPKGLFTDMIAEHPGIAEELKAMDAEPGGWKHDCAALCMNGVELWIDRCPHCGKPRTTPPATQAAPVSLQPAHDAVTIDMLNDRVMRQQAALTAALGALKNSVDTVWEEYTEAERKYAAYDSRRAKLDGMKAMAQAHTDAIAQIEALGE